MGIATAINRLLAAAFSMSALSAQNTVGWRNFFLIVAGMCLATLLFYYALVPETKGKHLEEMIEYFAEITGDYSILDMRPNSSDYRSSSESLLLNYDTLERKV